MPAAPLLRKRRYLGLVAIATSAMFVLSGCFPFRPPLPPRTSTVPPPVTEVTIPALSGSGEGAVSAIDISVAPNKKGTLAVEVSENEVGGVGRTLQSSAWNSAIVATLFTGADLANDYRFEFNGRVDGPSAGGVMTVAIMSLLLGDKLLPDVAMTGTITPTGTIGPVGGIPHKIAAVGESGSHKTVLIPLGQRNAPDNDGNLVDVIRLGVESGVEVIEVGDLAEAYLQMTGAALPSPKSVTIPRVNEAGYTSIESATRGQLTEFDRRTIDFYALSEFTQSIASEGFQSALDDSAAAHDLLNQGLVGGALMKAIGANMLMKALAGTYRTVDDMLIKGPEVLALRFQSVERASDVFFNYLDRLDSYKVETLAEAEALITAYGNSFDAYSLYLYAKAEFEAIVDRIDSYGSSEEILVDALLPLVYYEVSIAQIETAEAIFDLSRDVDGPALDSEVDITAVAEFFRKAADSNLEVFNADVISQIADSNGVSEQVALDYMSRNDLGIALASNATHLVGGIQNYLGDDNPNVGYAAMGYGWVNYARNASLIEKYGSNAILDPTTFTITGVRSDSRLVHALDFSRGQVAQALGVLGEKDYQSVLGVGAFEAATLAREGDFDEKFGAIQDYTGTFALSRVLAYLGGFSQHQYGK